VPVRRHDHRRAGAGSFSFKLAARACPTCTGIGPARDRPRTVIPDRDRSVADGALVPWSRMPTDGLADEDPRAIFDAHGWDIRLPVATARSGRPILNSRRRRRSSSPTGTSAARNLHGDLRGVIRTRAAIPGDGFRVHQDELQKYMVARRARLRRQAASPRRSASRSRVGTSGTSDADRDERWLGGDPARPDQERSAPSPDVLKEIGAASASWRRRLD